MPTLYLSSKFNKLSKGRQSDMSKGITHATLTFSLLGNAHKLLLSSQRLTFFYPHLLGRMIGMGQ